MIPGIEHEAFFAAARKEVFEAPDLGSRLVGDRDGGVAPIPQVARPVVEETDFLLEVGFQVLHESGHLLERENEPPAYKREEAYSCGNS